MYAQIACQENKELPQANHLKHWLQRIYNHIECTSFWGYSMDPDSEFFFDAFCQRGEVAVINRLHDHLTKHVVWNQNVFQ